MAAGEVAVERFSKRPARNRTVQSGNVTITTDARGRVSTKHRRRRTKLHPFLRRGLPSTPQESRRRRALAVQSRVSRPAPVSLVKSTQKNTVLWLRGRNRTPPWASPPYLTATPSRGPGERVGTPEVVHEVIRTRIRPRAGGDFRRGVWHEKARLSRLCWPTRGFGTLAYVWYCYPITKAPQASVNAQRLSKKSVLK